MDSLDQNTQSKKAVVINGSPKCGKSSTMYVTRAFIDGMKRVVPLDVSYIEVPKLNIKPCTGCLSCWSRSEGHCVIENDDVAEVKKKILESDYVIESFPLYFFGMPGQLKMLTDRLLSMMNTYVGQKPVISENSLHGIREQKPGQKLILISSCAYSSTEVVYDSLLKQFDCICGKNNYTPILCPQLQTVVHSSDDARLARFLKRYVAAGEKFVRDGLDSNDLAEICRPTLSDGTYKMLLGKFWSAMKLGKVDYD